MKTETFTVSIDEVRFEITVTTRREDPEFVKTLVVQNYLTNGNAWTDAVDKVVATFESDWDGTRDEDITVTVTVVNDEEDVGSPPQDALGE